ncbi:MAG: nucleoside triphosphate pyrophosphohydrolase [Sphingobacteriia bacterium]|nr:nucleoside triphosphate pyrophosphohydrolase [Sphingobacteriia bacterium]
MNYQSEAKVFVELLEIMDQLRAECPWDKKQTLESLRHLTIEETYELSDAIIKSDLASLKGELGDLLLHIVFYSKIANESRAFSIQEVIEDINKKLIIRHPHIFGDVTVQNAEEVKENWEKIKLQKENKRSVLGGVPESLPALIKAYRMQEKAAGVGFDWKNKEDVWTKVEEEKEEFLTEVENANKEKAQQEFGDLLFALINYARFIDVNPEDALEHCNQKFRKRFMYIEQEAEKKGRRIHELSLEEMDEYWNESKSKEI